MNGDQEALAVEWRRTLLLPLDDLLTNLLPIPETASVERLRQNLAATELRLPADATAS